MAEAQRIVLIDDSPPGASRVAQVLQSRGHVISRVCDRASARHCLAVGGNELIVVEASSVSPDGVSLLKLLASDLRGRRPLVVGAVSEVACVLDAIRAGAADVLPDPWTVGELEDALRRLEEHRVNFDESAIPAAAGITKLEFRTNGSLASVSFVVDTIVKTVSNFVDEHTARYFRVTLQEALRNALEHGNLGISGAEKEALCEAGMLDTEVARRLALESYRAKKISVCAEISDDEFRCVVLDAGEGFNWRAHMVDVEPSTDQESVKLNGRGVRLLRHFYDTVSYNEVGNELLFTKKLCGLRQAQ